MSTEQPIPCEVKEITEHKGNDERTHVETCLKKISLAGSSQGLHKKRSPIPRNNSNSIRNVRLQKKRQRTLAVLR